MSKYDKEPVEENKNIDWVAIIVLMALLGNDKIPQEATQIILEDMAKRNGVSLDEEKERNGSN